MELVRVDEKRRLWRWYSVYVREDLFDVAVLVRRWGRLGSTGGQVLVEPFATWEDAQAARQRLIDAKMRRGYRRLSSSARGDV